MGITHGDYSLVYHFTSSLLKDSEDSKPPCTYGANCYRSNKEHLDAFWHPPKFGRSLSSHNLRQPVDPTCPKCDKQLLLQRGENSDDK
eukprot:Awhi_evm1s7274